MPYLFILGVLVFIIGAIIFTVNKRESDRFTAQQLNERAARREEAENLHTFRSDVSKDKNDSDAEADEEHEVVDLD